MAPSGLNRLLVVALAVVTGVGSIDPLLDRDWDLLAVLVIALGLSLTLVARLESSRPDIPVRRDLVRWLRDRSAVSGESIGALTDRALASYRESYGHVQSEAGRDRP